MLMRTALDAKNNQLRTGYFFMSFFSFETANKPRHKLVCGAHLFSIIKTGVSPVLKE